MTTPPVHSARNPKTERWLDQLGVTWTFDPDLVLTKIDQAASLANQVRHNPLDHEVVDRYAQDMRQGDVFPALIVDATNHALLGGNHRHAAHNAAGNTTAPAYLVTGPTTVLLRIRVEDNRNHGLPTTEAERLDHGVALIAAGLTQVEAARVVGLDPRNVQAHLALIEATQAAEALGVDERFHRLSRGVRLAIGRLDDDTVFAAAANFAAAAAPNLASTRALVDACLSVEAVEALRLIATEAADHEERSRDMAGNVRATSRSARAKLDQALAVISGLDPQDVYDSCPNDDVRAVLAQRIMNAAGKLAPCHDLLAGKHKVRAA